MLRRLTCAAVLAVAALLGTFGAAAAAAAPMPAVTTTAMADQSSGSSMPGMDMSGTTPQTAAPGGADYATRYAVVGAFAALWVTVGTAGFVVRRRNRVERDRRSAARTAAQAG